MDLKTLTMLAIQVSIIATVFGFGLDTTGREVRSLFRRPGLLMRSLLAVFVVMPVVAIVLSRWFNFPLTVEVALVALAISPVPPMLPKKQAKAGGEEAYGIALLVVLAAVSVITIPLTLEFLARVLGRNVASPASAILTAVKSVIAPLAAGMLLRALVPGFAARLEKPVSLVAKVLLPLGVLVLLAGAFQAMWALFSTGTVLAIVLFLLVGLVVGHVLGGPDPDESVVLGLATANRHPAIAFAIASANYPDLHFGATILLYLIVGALVAVPYMGWVKASAGPPAIAGPRPRLG